MVNLRDVMTQECFEQVKPVFHEREEGKISSDECFRKILKILKSFRVKTAESRAFFIALVANGIAWEDVDPNEKPLKWYRKGDGLYISAECAKQTSAAYHGVS